MLRKTFAILFALPFIFAQLNRADAQTTLSLLDDIPIGFQNLGPLDFSDPALLLEGGVVPFARNVTFNEVTGEVTVDDGGIFSSPSLNIDRAGNATQGSALPGGGAFSVIFGATFRGPASLGTAQFASGITISHSTFNGTFSTIDSLTFSETATGNLLFDSDFISNTSPPSNNGTRFLSARYNRRRGTLFVQEAGKTLTEVLPSGVIDEFVELNDLGISLGRFEINQRDGNLYNISANSVDIFDPGDGSLLESIDISSLGVNTILGHAIDSDRGDIWILDEFTDPGLGTPENPQIVNRRLLRIGTIAIPEPSQVVVVPFLLALSALRRRKSK